MSVRVSTWVWHHSDAAGNDRLILLALADNSDDEGRSWPSVAALALKTRLSRATVQRRLRSMTTAGRIVVDDRTGTSNLYTIVLSEPPAVQAGGPQSEAGGVPQSEAPHEAGGASPSEAGGASPSEAGGASPSEALTVIEPSVNRHRARGARAVTIPDDFALTPDLAEVCRRKHPGLDPQAEFEQFRDHHIAKGSKMVDWQAAWRTWQRNAVKYARPTPIRPEPSIPAFWRSGA